MKKNPALVGFLVVLGILGAIVLFYFSFLDKKSGYVVDNPSDQKIELEINGKKYSVAPKQTVRLDLEKGEQKLKYQYKNQVVDTVIDIQKSNGLLNPTGAEYYTFNRPYGVRENVDSLFRSSHVTIDDKVYFGNIKKSNKIYIENFYYNLDENFPKLFFNKEGEAFSYSFSTKKERTNLTKIFNEEDFKQFYFENYE